MEMKKDLKLEFTKILNNCKTKDDIIREFSLKPEQELYYLYKLFTDIDLNYKKEEINERN